MFFKKYKERIDKLERRIDTLIGEKVVSVNPDTTECEKCGCLVYRVDENKGEPEIRKRAKSMREWYDSPFDEEDYIYYPYYCKTHKPKVKKEG